MSEKPEEQQTAAPETDIPKTGPEPKPESTDIPNNVNDALNRMKPEEKNRAIVNQQVVIGELSQSNARLKRSLVAISLMALVSVVIG